MSKPLPKVRISHFEADLGTLVDRRAHGHRLGAADVHQQRVLGTPRRQHAVQAPLRQRLAVAVLAVGREHERAERRERGTGRDRLRRPDLGFHLEQAARLLLVVDLGLKSGSGSQRTQWELPSAPVMAWKLMSVST